MKNNNVHQASALDSAALRNEVVITDSELNDFAMAHASQYIKDLQAERDELLAALKECRDELVILNRTIGWRDGEWPQVTTANASIEKAEQP